MPLDTDGRWSSSATPIPLSANPTLNDGAIPSHTLVDTRGLFVLHAVLLHTGKVLWFCGHVESAFYAPRSYVFDPKSPATLLTAIPFPAGMDLFCCHYVQLPNGRILVVGGSDKDFLGHGSVGAKNICIFDPTTKTWGNTHNDLTQGRWYPTPVLLPDGRVMVVSGRPEHLGGSIADKVEILIPPRRASTELTVAPAAVVVFPIYPGLHLAPNGRVYFTGTTWGQEIANPDTASIEVPTGPAPAASWTVHVDPVSGIPVHPAQPRREEGMSVLLPLLPPAYKGEILLIGGSEALDAAGNGVLGAAATPPGGPAVFDHIHSATDPFSAEILDTTPPTPGWSAAPGSPMSFGRTNGHCVLLPDATVLIVGGHNGYKWQARPTTRPSLEAEIFTPGTGFRVVAAMNEPRMYHSIALLLPDGRVLVAGGADPNDVEPLPLPGSAGPPIGFPAGWVGRTYPHDPSDPTRTKSLIPLNRKTFEFYEPPYYFKPDRASQPIITDVLRGGSSTGRIRYGQTFKVRFTVGTNPAASIDKVAFMRPGACTHHTDTEQRYVRLAFTPGSGELTVTAVSDPKVAPPGYYMLWIVDTSGRPCKDAWFVHLVV